MQPNDPSDRKRVAWMLQARELRERKPRHLLFLCVANSARSQLAEGLARHLAPDSTRVSSAGSAPGSVNPNAIAVLRELGIDIAAHHSKGLGSIDLATVDAVVTLCGEEVCPSFPHAVHKIHWALPDPAAVPTDPAARTEAFREARDELLTRLRVVFGSASKH